MYACNNLTNFAPPHFAAGGIPKNTPHGKMEGHTAYIYMLSVYPFRMELFSFSLYTKHTLLHSLIFFVKYGKGREVCPSELHSLMQFWWENFSSCLYACETWMYQSADAPSFVWRSVTVSVCCREGPLVRVPPSSFVSELSSNCPSSSLSGSLPSSSSSDEILWHYYLYFLLTLGKFPCLLLFYAKHEM